MSISQKIEGILQKLAEIDDLTGEFVTETSDLIQELFDELPDEDISELVASSVEEGIFSLEQGIYVLSVAVWSGGTNGGDLMRTTTIWLMEAKNKLRVHLALENDIMPIPTENMTQVYTRIKTTFPEFSEICESIIGDYGPDSPRQKRYIQWKKGLVK